MAHASNYVSSAQIRKARIADLYGFLESCHGQHFKRVGCCLCLKSKDSIYIKKGVPGYMDFSTGNHGNAIDFLVDQLGYGFLEAVNALAGNPVEPDGIVPEAETACPEPAVSFRRFIPPSPAPRPFREVYAYLEARGLPSWVVSRMENEGILYQESGNNNAVFITPQKDFCEIRGTYGGRKNHFHSCRKASPDRFWYITSGTEKPQRAFICESAIDAVSLLLLRSRAGDTEPSVFISIGGVCNQKAINRVKAGIRAVIAVDNDAAGERCRSNNRDLFALTPVNKDWNEDLLVGVLDGAYH